MRHLLPITTIFPTLMFVLIALGISQALGFELRGLSGIVGVHAALNAPLLALLLLPSAEAIPENYHKQRHLLGLSAWRYGFWVVLPLFRPALIHALSLVFLLCFTSFTTPLIIGGSPHYATLEVAIYQAIKYEFNLSLAAQLAFLQLLALLPLFACMPKTPPAPPKTVHSKRFVHVSATVCELLGLGLLSVPVLMMVVYGLQAFDPHPPKALWHAIEDSLMLALLTVPLALTLHWLLMQQINAFQKRLMEALYLMPVLMLCLGSYLLLKPYVSLFAYPTLANALLISITAQPYLYQFSLAQWQQHHLRTQRLALHLGLSAWQKWLAVDLPALAPLLSKVAGLAAIVCMGDVAVSRFYQNTQFQTLAAYLSEELGHYRHNRAWQTGVYFLLLSLVVYWLPQLLARYYLKRRTA